MSARFPLDSDDVRWTRLNDAIRSAMKRLIVDAALRGDITLAQADMLIAYYALADA